MKKSEDSDFPRGYIHWQASVWCGLCANWEWIDNAAKKHLVKGIKSMGWKFTRRNGWVCPSCQEDERK